MLWNFTQRLSWLGLVSANAQVGVCACVHSSPHSLLWLSCAQRQLFAAFRMFCSLEVKSHSFLLTAHHGDIHWKGYPGWCRTALARPCFPWSDFCPGRRQGIRMQRATWREGWIFWGPSWYVLFQQNVFLMVRVIVLYCIWAERLLKRQFLSPSEISWSSYIASVCFLSQLEKV